MKTHKLVNATVALLSSAVLMLSPLAVFADTTNSTQVVNSGDNASVNSSANQNTTVNVSNTNTADISQTVNASSNTGGNTANSNIGGGTINTGTANIGVTLNAVANHNVTGISGLDPSSSNTTGVVNTGDHLNVNTNTNTNTNVGVSNVNIAEVSQSVMASANSGKNSANENIGGGTVNTGSANVGVTLNTDVNHNLTAIAGDPGDPVSNNTSITNTGDHVHVTSNVNSNLELMVGNLNEAEITQMLFGNANSGHNHANENIGGGTVNTGTTNVGATLNASGNTNLTGIGLGIDPFLSNMFDVVNTGNNLHSSATLNSNVEANTENTNLLSLLQMQFSHSNSGHNSSSENIFGGLVHTGGSNAWGTFNFSSNLNTTLMGGIGSFVLGLLGLI